MVSGGGADLAFGRGVDGRGPGEESREHPVPRGGGRNYRGPRREPAAGRGLCAVVVRRRVTRRCENSGKKKKIEREEAGGVG